MDYCFEEEKSVWDEIAPSWHRLRRKPFPFVLKLANEWRAGRILDVGCGNGRNLIPFFERRFGCFGIDISLEILKLGKDFVGDGGIYFFQASATSLPFREECFDYVLCIATLHHLPKELQVRLLGEIKRVLKSGGKAFITVWNKLQPRFFLGSKERKVPWKLSPERTLYRYYYFFTMPELRKALLKTGFKIVFGKGFFGKNIEFLVEKP